MPDLRALHVPMDAMHMITNNLVGVLGAVLGLATFTTVQVDARPAPSVWLSTELIGMKVVSQDGVGLGKIEDVVVHPGSRSAYAVLTFGEWHGVGDKVFAMPWTVLRTVQLDSSKKDSARSLVLPLDRERLKTAPGFDKDNWPSFANPDWTKDIDAFYVGDSNPNFGAPTGAASAPRTHFVWRVSELKGVKVSNPDGETLGDVQQLAIDTNGRVSYATLSVGGFLGIGDRIVPIPWDMLKFTLGGEKSDKKLISLACTKKQLESAPEFLSGKEHRAQMCDLKWVGRVYEHFSCPIYWSQSTAAEASSGSSK